jgi:uncharacterized membrane protein
MTSSRNKAPLIAASVALGIVYPFIVYLTLDLLPAGVFVVLGLAMVAGRIAVVQERPWAKAFTVSLGTAGILLVVISLIDRYAASRAYPVLMSLSAAAVFGYSLMYPPTLIEQIAGERTTSKPGAVPYLRKLSAVWLVFLLINATVSAGTAILGDLATWTLYNGFISYLLSGALLFGEIMLRPHLAPQSTG